MYVIFEGNDGGGKDSQADMLVSRLIQKGQNPLRVAEPCEDLPHGRLLRDLLSSGEHQASHAALFLADRMALQESIVCPALQAGRPVVSVRSFLSTLVYQQENWPLGWLLDIHRMMLAKPTVIIYLDIDPQEGLDRVGKRGTGKEVYEKIDILERNRARYLSLMEGDDLTALMEPHCLRVIVDASGTREEVHEAIVKALQEPRGYALFNPRGLKG
jgi:dTMP kinase